MIIRLRKAYSTEALSFSLKVQPSASIVGRAKRRPVNARHYRRPSSVSKSIDQSNLSDWHLVIFVTVFSCSFPIWLDFTIVIFIFRRRQRHLVDQGIGFRELWVRECNNCDAASIIQAKEMSYVCLYPVEIPWMIKIIKLNPWFGKYDAITQDDARVPPSLQYCVDLFMVSLMMLKMHYRHH